MTNFYSKTGTKLLVLFINCCISLSFGQTTIYSDNFNNGCASNCLATTYGGWTIINNDGGVSGGSSNNWFVSCAEEGVTPPGCGSSCIGDASLHIGADPGGGGDMGASFNETGAVNATFKTVVSPTINTTGHSTLTLSFDFIAYGSAGCSDDRAQLRLSTDNGATWPAGYQYCLTSVCCGACNGYSQGQWTTYTLALPAAFENNPNVRIGFNWRNNGNGSGTDPSIAVDDIRITKPIALGVDLISFTAEKSSGNGPNINWKVANETNFSHYELQRSYDGTNFSKIYKVNGNCSNKETCNYSYKDVAQNKLVYYRLKMVDLDGSVNYSYLISLDESSSTSSQFTLISSSIQEDQLYVNLNTKKKGNATYTLYGISGKAVYSVSDVALKSGINQHNYDVGKLSKGVYILKISIEGESASITSKVIKN